MFCFYVKVGEEWRRVEDINYGSTVWAAPVPLPCSRGLYLPCVIPQKTLRCLVPASRAGRFKNEKQTCEKTMKIRRGPKMQHILLFFGQHRTIPALRLKHRSGSCGTASALPKCSIMSGCGTRIVLRGQKPLALCDRCPCFGSLFPPLAALTFAASSIICAFGLASAAPRSPYRHLELCGIAFDNYS